MAIRLRRGLNADRTTITPEPGEPLWTTDTELLYIGDGATPGGNPVGGGTGDVVGPSSSVDNRVVFFDGTTGKLIRDSGLTLSPAALTKIDDTNVTLTLGGTPTTSLLAATSLTLGWTGQLSTSRGGTGLATLGTSNQLIRVNSGATALEYFTPSYITSAVTSVGMTVPSAFSVTPSTITTSGTFSVTGAGTSSQYIRGDGTLAAYSPGGGGASVNYYLNGSVTQGTFGGVSMREINKTPIIGTGTDFPISTNGYIQSFITDANDPNQLTIPSGNWNFEMYFSASSGGGTPSFYVELYKWDGTTLTSIASSSANPEGITNGTAIDLYITALAVPSTVLAATDRLAVRVWVNNSGRTITLHTENSHLCQVITTFTTGLTALNGLTEQVQYFSTGTSGTDFAISSTGFTHTFNLPTASATKRGALSTADWTTFNSKESALTFSAPLSRTANTISIPAATSSVNGYLSSTDWTTFNGKQAALSGTGFVKISGTAISYDSSTYLTTISGITAGGELSGTYANPSLVNSAVIGKVLTGVNITGGTISATDSILIAFGKVQNQINGLIGGSTYQGTWNALTNTPLLTSSVGTPGYYYIANVAGSTNLNGITDWNIGDWAIFNGGVWQKVDNTDAVVSVNGLTGAVSLTTSNIAEGSNLYFTNVRAISAILTGYVSGPGTISATDTILTAIQKLNGNIGSIVSGVSSVFGRTGAVVSASGDYTTSQVTESTNLYYTDVRARSSNSFVAGSGAYNSTTGVITIPTNNNQITNGSNFITLASLSGSTGISYNNTTGVISSTITQYTDALARAAITLTTTGTSGAATYSSVTGVLNIPEYNGMVYPGAGIAVSTGTAWGTSITNNSTNWDTAYTNRITSLTTTGSGPATLTSNVLNIPTPSAATFTSLTTTGSSGSSTLLSGVLNVPAYTLAGLGGQPLATNLTSLSGLSYASTSFVKMTGTGAFALDTNTYITGNQSITLSGDVSGTGSTVITTTIGANKVLNTMLAQVATATFKGRTTAGAGNVEDLTVTEATAMLNLFSTAATTKGLVPGSNGVANTNFLRADGTWAVPAGGGGASDYLSALTGAEIAITTTATATINRQHLISGTTADYIVTLPAASTNTGKFIGIRIDVGASRLFTIKGNASELIDGVNTRIMWKGETAILYCYGTGWKKMAGVSIPMTCQMYQTSVNTTLFLNNTDTKVPITGIKVNNTGFMANAGSRRIDIKRTGIYSLKGAVSYNNFSVNSPRALTQLRVNASSVCNSDCSALIGSYATPFATTDLTLNLNDYVELWGLQTSGVTQGVWGHATLVATMILATEITTW
jgi:hypothetical protein